MNIMNQMKHSNGYWQVLKNIFIFWQCKACFYVHFATSSSLIYIRETLTVVLMVVDAYLMNQMKNYEEGFIKRVFEFCFFCYGELMNMGKGGGSLKFINLALSPLCRPLCPIGHLPQISLREYLGEKEQGL